MTTARSTSSLTLPWPIAGRPTVIHAGRFPHADRAFETRYHGRTHALHLYDYPATMRLGRRELTLRSGDMTCTPAGVETRYALPHPGHHLCIHFRLPAMRGEKAALPLFRSLGPRRDFAADQMREIANLHRLTGHVPGAAAAASALLQGLLLWLVTFTEDGRTAAGSDRAELAVRQAAEQLERSLDQPLSVPNLAGEIGLSQNYLAHHFRQRYGMTIPRYLLHRRIELAQDLLQRTALPVSDIAQRAGLGDPQHFNKQFRRLTGHSPSAYRKLMTRRY